MADATYVRVYGTRLELADLASATTYYVKVRVITADGDNLGPYSDALAVTTQPATGYSLLAPLYLKAKEATQTTLTLAWGSRGSGLIYRVALSAKPDMSGAVRYPTRATSFTVKNLSPGTRYYAQVQALTEDRVPLSAYSPTATVATAAPPEPLAAPEKFTLVQLAQTSVALRWEKLDGATRYRLQYSTSSRMTNPTNRTVTGTYAEVPGFSKGRTYYFRIAGADADGAVAGAFTPVIKGTTPTGSGDRYLTPSGLNVTSARATRLRLTWNHRSTGLRYQVRYARRASMSGALLTGRTGSAGIELSGLAENVDYFLQVRVVSSTGQALSKFGPWPAVAAHTPLAPEVPLTVASYNIKCANCYAGATNEGTWYQRRDSVVATIRAQAPDVIGIQEASQGWLKDSKGNPISLSQFEDLEDRLGAPYKVTNSHRNNCVKSYTPTNCVYKDQGASQGTKIFYNTDVLRLVAQGSRRLSEIRSSDNDRYVAWAIFEEIDTTKRFFFANTHLEPTADTSGQTRFANLRITQAKEILATIDARNPDRLPTFIVGDLNSSKRSIPTNGPYDAFLGAGYVDPLGNFYASTYTTQGATVENRIRTNFASYNGFRRLAPSVGWINAANIDYILTSPGVRVAEWETSVNIDADGNFIGRIPSDHNLLRATVQLPVATPQN
jgi:endonuclease/exonuclease/phosphatase family metal-dependent hydrolase